MLLVRIGNDGHRAVGRDGSIQKQRRMCLVQRDGDLVLDGGLVQPDAVPRDIEGNARVILIEARLFDLPDSVGGKDLILDQEHREGLGGGGTVDKRAGDFHAEAVHGAVGSGGLRRLIHDRAVVGIGDRPRAALRSGRDDGRKTADDIGVGHGHAVGIDREANAQCSAADIVDVDTRSAAEACRHRIGDPGLFERLKGRRDFDGPEAFDGHRRPDLRLYGIELEVRKLHPAVGHPPGQGAVLIYGDLEEGAGREKVGGDDGIGAPFVHFARNGQLIALYRIVQHGEVGDLPAVDADRHAHFERRFKQYDDLIERNGAAERDAVGARADRLPGIAHKECSAHERIAAQALGRPQRGGPDNGKRAAARIGSGSNRRIRSLCK